MAMLFLSYSSDDKNMVKKIAVDLKSNGFDVWLDEWEIKVGQSIVKSVGRGIDEADFIVLALSKSAIKSGWVEAEWSTAYWDQIRGGKIRLLPVLLEECEIPSLLKSVKYADFKRDYKYAMHELIDSLRQYTKIAHHTDGVIFASDRYLWQNSKNAIAFKNVMERWGFEHFSVYDDEIIEVNSQNTTSITKHINKNADNNLAIKKLKNAVNEASQFSSEENSKKILAKVRKKINEMIKELGVSYSDAYSCCMTAETNQMIINCVEEPFKTFLFALDRAIDKNEANWKENTEEALECGAQTIKAILDVGRKYDNETAEADADEVVEWMVNILYIIGGTPTQGTGIPTLGLNPFPSYSLEIRALQASVDGDNPLGLAITRAWIYNIFLEQDYERRLKIISEYLDRLDWCEEDGDGEMLLGFLQYAIIENKLDIPRKATIKLIENKAKYLNLDEDVDEDLHEDIVTTLENLAEQLKKL